jgi:hypothetical protein
MIKKVRVTCQAVHKEQDWLSLKTEIPVVKPQPIHLNEFVFRHLFLPTSPTGSPS